MTTTEAAETEPAAPPARPAARAHMHQIDLVRVLVFASVIGVHTTSRVNGDAGQSANAVEMGLHFTREAFFALSGFVLFYGVRSGVKPGPAWLWRRVRLVALPYVVWSVIYWADNWALASKPGGVGSEIGTLFYDLGTGGACYHLYFLLVTIQIYVFFPLLVWLVRRTDGRHAQLMAATLVFQAAWLSWLQYAEPAGSDLGGVIGHADTLLPSYLFWVIGGMVAAAHREAFDAWVARHTWAVVVYGLVSLGAAEAVYGAGVQIGDTPLHAAAVLQPIMLAWGTGAILLVYAAGLAWARRPSRPLAKQVATASLASFGVFLAHPLVLQLLTSNGLGNGDSVMPSALATLSAYALTVVGAAVLVAVFLHTPFATMLTGRPRLKRKPGTRGPARSIAFATVLALAFAGSVTYTHQAQATYDKNRFAADEFTQENSLVTTPATGTPKAGATPKPKQTGPAVQTQVTLTYGGLSRHYLMAVPSTGGAGLPLLVFLHGVSASPSHEITRDGFLPLADNGTAVLLYPEGYGYTWNSGDCCGLALKDNLDDVGFIHTVISQVEAQLKTDTSKVFVDGFSNGARMAWRLSCEAPQGITAFAEMAGNPPACATGTTRAAVPYFIGVGGKDGTEPIGGKSTDDRGTHPALAPELKKILALDGCSATSSTKTVSTVTYTTWSQCKTGPVIVADWLTEDHHWPRPPIVTAAGSAPTLMWAFFSAL